MVKLDLKSLIFYREAADPCPSVFLDRPRDLEVVLGAGRVALEAELGEEEAELAGGGAHGPHAFSVVGVVRGVVWGLEGQGVAEVSHY